MTCDAHIRAARDTNVGGNRNLDRRTCTGFCCRHASPLKGAFRWWETHERFVQYNDVLFALVSERRLNVEGLALDTCCR